MKKIYLAGGCFWGLEHYIRQVSGIICTTVGYANSLINSPSYEEVKRGLTDAAETVEIEYDDTIINLHEIIQLYFKTIDPESIDKQGEDEGHQYRTGIYYVDDKDLEIISEEINALKKVHSIINIEVMKLINFYKAEDYHQDYLIKNPQGYCHIPQELIKYAKKYKNK